MHRFGFKKLSELNEEEAIKAVEYGLKPLALVTRSHDTELAFISFELPCLRWEVQNGRKVIMDVSPATQFVYYSEGQEGNAQRLMEISIAENKENFGYQAGDSYISVPMSKSYHREMGTLLGYTEQEIEDFLNIA